MLRKTKTIFSALCKTKSESRLLDGIDYQLRTRISINSELDVPRIVIVSYQPKPESSRLMKVCLEAIREFTEGPYEIWVVDNASPWENIDWMLKEEGINLVLNRTVPIPIEERGGDSSLEFSSRPSYQNAMALEIAAALVPQKIKYFMSMHMDTMPIRSNWLSFLMSKMSKEVRASGVRLDDARVTAGILHVLGFLVCFQTFRKLKLSYLPALPDYDTGDLVSVGLRNAGYELWACNNLRSDPKLIEGLRDRDKIFENMDCDRCLDDDGNVIFLHLGRGIVKTTKLKKDTDILLEWEGLLNTF